MGKPALLAASSSLPSLAPASPRKVSPVQWGAAGCKQGARVGEKMYGGIRGCKWVSTACRIR
eukprot:scaffold142759_cov57-Phaeocystis_antarctica.AAC.1